MKPARSANVVQLNVGRSRVGQEASFTDAGPRPRSRSLMVFLAASFGLHALLVVLSGSWTIQTKPPVPLRPLDVIVVTERPPEIAPQPPSPPSRSERRESPVPQKKPRVQPAPAMVREAVPVTPAPAPARTVAPVVVPSTGVEAPSPAPVTAPSAAVAQREGEKSGAPSIALTPPSFNAGYLNNPPPAYPASARRRGESGMVLLRVKVSSTGKPYDVRVSKSAGVDALDQAALEAVRGWTFVPARRGDVAVEAWVEVPIQFRLEGR